MILFKIYILNPFFTLLSIFFFLGFTFNQTPTGVTSLWQSELADLQDSQLLEVYEFCSRQWGIKVRSDIDSSIIFAQKALDIAQYLNNDSMSFQSHRRIANSYIQNGNYKQARLYTDTMHNLLDTFQHYNAYRYYNTIGQIDYYQGQYEEALKNHLKSLQHARSGNLLENIPAALGEIARVFDDMGQPLKALEYALQDVAFTMEHGGARGKFIANYNLANKYVSLDSFNRALEVYNTADSLLQDLNIPVYTAALQLSKGRLLVQMDKPQAAIPLLDEAISIMNQAGNKRGEFTAKLHKGNALNKLERYNDALPILQESYTEFENLGIFDLEQSSRKSYAEALHQSGNSFRAYELLEQYEYLKDSLQKAETQETINDLELKYQTAEKENQIKEQELEIVRNKNQKRLWAGGFITLFIIAGIALFFMYRDREKKRKLAAQEIEIKDQKIEQLEQEKNLHALNSMIEGQEAERKRIAQDLHDGLGGMLTGLKGQIQSLQKKINELSDYDIYGKANNMIDAASKEVRRIAYNMMPLTLSKLGLKAATEDFAVDLAQNHPIKVTAEITGLENRLPEAKEVMLYRIVQELCTNVIRHSGATELLIQTQKVGSKLVLLIEDNGKGFQVKEIEKTNGVGLRSIQSRVKFLKGNINLDSSGAGTIVTIEIPVEDMK